MEVKDLEKLKEISERVMNSNLSREDKEIILPALRDFIFQNAKERDAIEANKENVYGGK